MIKTSRFLAIIITALLSFTQFTGCESKEEKGAFLDIGSNDASSISETEMNVKSSLKTDLLRNGKELLKSSPLGIDSFCTNYGALRLNDRLEFWVVLISAVISENNVGMLEKIDCNGLEQIDRALCVSNAFNSLFTDSNVSVQEVLTKELLLEIQNFPGCN